jgi:hypothetical protein
MSFQRSLTGESTIYANVILNTNISASSVSTTNLSATNASFTNITTNTWTTGNVSTPNVIATNGYFSNLYISTWSVSSESVLTLNASQAYISNLSTSNISNSSLISTSTLRAFITNVSTENSCLVNTSTLYTTYAYVSNISISNICVTGSLDVDGDVIGVTGRFEHFQIKNSGGNTQFEVEQVSNYTNLNIVNSGVQSMEFTRLNSSLLSLNTSQVVAWNPIYSSTLYASTLSASSVSASTVSTTNLSTQNISNTSNITTSVLTAYITNVSTDNSCLVNTSTLYSTYAYVSNISMSNASIDVLSVATLGLANLSVSTLQASNIEVDFNGEIYVDGTVETNYCINQYNQIKNSGGNVVFETYNKNTSQAIVMNIDNTGTNYIDFKRLNSDLMRLSTSQIFFYNPTYSSTNYASTTFTSTGNFSNLNVSTYTSISTSYRANFSSISASNISCSALTASGDIEAKSALITNNGVVFKEFNSSGMIPIYANIYEIIGTSNQSIWNFEGFGVNEILFNVYGTDTLNMSENYLSAVNGTLNISNISAKQVSTTNLSVTNISVATLTATTKVSTSNLSINGLTSTSYVSAFVVAGLSSVTGQIIYTSNIFCSQQVNASQVSCSSVSAKNVYTSDASFSTASGTTLSVSTLNVSTIAGTTTFTNLSTTNMSVSTSATIQSVCVSNLWVSAINFLNGVSALQYGYIQKSGFDLAIMSQATGGNVAITRIGNNGNIRFDIGQSGVSCYVSFHCSRGNFSVLSVSTFNPNTITTTTITASTINASTLSVSTFNPATIETTTINASTGNFSTLNASTWTFPATISTTTFNGSTGNFSTLNGSTVSGGTIRGTSVSVTTGNFSTLNASTWNLPSTITISQLNTCNISALNMSVATMTVSLRIDAEKLNVINICVSNISATDITSGDANISYIYSDTLYPNYIVCSQGAEFADVINASNISIQKINNSFSTMSTSLPLTIWSVSNNEATGLRVPTFIDSQDLGALTIGYNQSAGFINVCRATRFYSNILTDSNINGIAATDSITIGNNTTTGNLRIGNTGMTGNVCITTDTGNINFSTAGDVTFNCDRRSTWNTSDILKNSTQLGSFYQQTTSNSNTKTNTGITYVFSPNTTNTSLSVSPVGLYLVSAQARLRTNGAYSARITQFELGLCHSSGYNFTTGNTSRTQFVGTGSLNTSGTSTEIWTIGCTGIINMSIENRYIGAYMTATADQAATVGNIQLFLDCVTVVKIA